MKAQKNTWLGRQIDSAKKSLEDRPEWMKRAAHFKGTNTTPVRSTDESTQDCRQNDKCKSDE